MVAARHSAAMVLFLVWRPWWLPDTLLPWWLPDTLLAAMGCPDVCASWWHDGRVVSSSSKGSHDALSL